MKTTTTVRRTADGYEATSRGLITVHSIAVFVRLILLGVGGNPTGNQLGPITLTHRFPDTVQASARGQIVEILLDSPHDHLPRRSTPPHTLPHGGFDGKQLLVRWGSLGNTAKIPTRSC